ncbi:recombinase family protein [Streptomyces endophyticus]|uniref:Recombinase family protein n=1 Tax=Streptomyces endophyticus TaxID=714166 RepID=A0ABU6FCN4_9ACTN|nr:recombinase family protein [Streptomyces endophyticus]MEB8341800.1 recombinase family protein [Streptomyces endophyticus]
MATQRRVVIYCRISDDREGRRWGVDRQERVCRERADQNGWDVVEVLVENDISAYSGKVRPKYQRLLTMLRAGEANAVIALSGKRLQRDWRDAFAFLDLAQERDIAVDTIKAGRYNLNTAEGRAQARRAAIDAQEESEEIGERVWDAKQDNLREGTYRGGPRPFGYEADGMTVRTLVCPSCPGADGFTADRECRACGAGAVNKEGSEAWYIEQAIDTVARGGSLRGVCRDWTEKGLLTPARRTRQADGTRGDPAGRPWGPTAMRKLLRRPRNAGLIDYKGEVVGRAAWPAIVSETAWRDCTEVLDNPSRRPKLRTGRRWLGTGLFECGRCDDGSTLYVTTSGGGSKGPQPTYRCDSCQKIGRNADSLEALVEGVAVKLLSREDAADLFLPRQDDESDRRELLGLADVLRAKLSGYAEDYDNDLITRQQMLEGTARVRARLAEVELQMAAGAGSSVLALLPLGTPDIAAAWKGFELDRKRSIINLIMTVRVHPAKRGRPKGYVPGSGIGYFDASTIEIVPKEQPATSLAT